MRTRWIMGLIAGAIALGIIGLGVIGLGVTGHLSPGDETATRPIRMGQPFELSLDQTATVESDALELMLIDINDSRCPANVQCAWAGQVTTTLTVTKAGTPIGTVELTQQPGHEVAAIQKINGYSLELMDVMPHPTSGEADPFAYQATLRLMDAS